MSSYFDYMPSCAAFHGIFDSNKIDNILYKDYESMYDRLLDRTNPTTLAILRLRIPILKV